MASKARCLLLAVGLVTALSDTPHHGRRLLEACALPESQQTTPITPVAVACPLSAPPRLLFLGNSFTNFFDLPGMVVAQLEQAANCTGTTVASHVPGSYQFVNHEADLNRSTSPLYSLLGAGRDPATTYTHAVFQEQSQIPGFDPRTIYQQSGRALESLAAAAKEAGVREPLLFNTWGYRTGDRRNPSLYPDYATMQAKLDRGYNRYQSGFVPSAKVVKAGLGWQRVHRDAGSSPDSALFMSLFDPDNKHPAVAGTYLSALTIANSVAGMCLTGGPVPAGVDDSTAAYLQCTACQAYLGQSDGSVS